MTPTKNDNDKPADAAPAAPSSVNDTVGPVGNPDPAAPGVSTTQRVEGVENSLGANNPDHPDNPVNQNGFVGVDPIYQNYANDTEKPLNEDGDPIVADDAVASSDKGGK